MKILIILILITTQINTQNLITTEEIASTDINNNLSNSCLVSCEECGKNAKHCIFNPQKCTIKCECKQGYSGETCNQIDHSNNTDIYSNTTLDQINTYDMLKEKAWGQILKSIASYKFLNGDMAFIEGLIKNLNFVFKYIFTQNNLSHNDVYKLSIVFKKLNTLSINKLVLNEYLIEHLFDIYDMIQSMNYFNINESILVDSNLKLNNTSLDLVESIDQLTKYFRLKSIRFSLKFTNFQLLILNLNPNNLMNDLKFTTASNQSSQILIDSISLNEEILRKIYKNNSITIAFKIYFNYYFNKSDETLTSEFYKNIQQQQQRTQLKSTNFFYQITNDQTINNNYFISSNVLSAVIYSNETTDTYIPKHNDKFVRIQFVVDLNQFNQLIVEKSLKCVYWNFTRLNWSTNGCFESIDESKLINENFYQKVCYCNHLTNFALLFDPNNDLNETNFFNKFLTYLTFIGIGTSSICYIILITTRLLCVKKNPKNIPVYYKNINNKQIMFKLPFRQQNQVNNYRDLTLRKLYLSNTICLLISNLMFCLVILVKPSTNFNLCRLVSAILHYFLLCSFCFSFGIAWQHFNKLAKIFKDYSKKKFSLKFIHKWYLFSFIAPFIFSSYGYLSQENDLKIILTDNCWLKTPHLYYLFIGPISILLILSLIFYLIVCVKVLSIYKNFISFKNIQDLKSSLNTSYNNRRVIIILTFSFITLDLTWLLGLFIVLFYHIESNLKLLIEFLFCLFNSFHGLSLLIGNYLALKYSKSNDCLITTKTTTTSNQNNSQLSSRNSNNNNNNYNSPIKRKLSLKTRFYLQLYSFINGIRSLFGDKNTTMNKIKKTKKNEKKMTKKNEATKQKRSTFLEFTFVNYEDSDSNNQNLHTIQTHLPIETHIYNEYLPDYFNSVIREKSETNLNDKNDQNLSNNLEQDVYTSSI